MTTRKSVLTILAALACLCFPGKGQAQQRDTLQLRTMTYNLRFGERASLEDIAAHIRAFNPDFVALEEVDCKTFRQRAPQQNGRDFIAALAYHTGMFGLYGKTINYAKGYYGIGILSRYPYISVNKTMLPNPSGKEPRALLEGLFDVDILTSPARRPVPRRPNTSRGISAAAAGPWCWGATSMRSRRKRPSGR